jgi:hypothetical protein
MPNFSIDFGEVDSPSAKQVDFVQEICRVLHMDEPREYTKQAYSNFISENIEDFKDAQWSGDGLEDFDEW